MTSLENPPVAALLVQLTEQMKAPALLSEDPRTEAGELLAGALQIDPRELEGRFSSRLTSEEQLRLRGLVERRLASEPTAYLVGGVTIGGLRFSVDRRGFIPRLDLPVLFEAALERTPLDVQGHGLDLACGIGAAGICVAHRRPGLHVDLADVSAEAIELARENAARLVPGRVSCFSGDLFEALPPERRGSYAVITANPPWVPDGTELPPEVIDHEPRVSFFGGPDGLDLVRRIVAQLPAWLRPGGVYAQECDPSQVPTLLGMLTGVGLTQARAHADREGVRRVVSAVLPSARGK